MNKLLLTLPYPAASAIYKDLSYSDLLRVSLICRDYKRVLEETVGKKFRLARQRYENIIILETFLTELEKAIIEAYRKAYKKGLFKALKEEKRKEIRYGKDNAECKYKDAKKLIKVLKKVIKKDNIDNLINSNSVEIYVSCDDNDKKLVKSLLKATKVFNSLMKDLFNGLLEMEYDDYSYKEFNLYLRFDNLELDRDITGDYYYCIDY
jgi:hypothetical protein